MTGVQSQQVPLVHLRLAKTSWLKRQNTCRSWQKPAKNKHRSDAALLRKWQQGTVRELMTRFQLEVEKRWTATRKMRIPNVTVGGFQMFLSQGSL